MNQKTDNLRYAVDYTEDDSNNQLQKKVYEGRVRYKAGDAVNDNNDLIQNYIDNYAAKQDDDNQNEGKQLRRHAAQPVGEDISARDQYSFREDDSQSNQNFQKVASNSGELDGSLAERLLEEAHQELMQNYKANGASNLGMGIGGTMGASAMGPSIVAGSSEQDMSTEAIQNELKMLDKASNNQREQFNKIQFAGDLAEIGKIARSIDDISIDSAKVDLRERGGDELENRMNLQSILKNEEEVDGDCDDDTNNQFQETPKQRRASAMRRGAGTGAGYAENNKVPAKKNKHAKHGSEDKNQAQSATNGRNQRNENDDSESCYINQSEIQSQASHSQSQSQLTSERSHFTSIEGPPKVYEEIMRQLEADIRKHIRIEHQLKLHIESVEDRVEELEREQEINEKKLSEMDDLQKLVESLKNDIKEKDKIIDEQKESLEKHDEIVKTHEQIANQQKHENEELLGQMKQLKEDNENTQKELKVVRSQNQREKELIKQLQQINNEQSQQNNRMTYGPYQTNFDDNNNKAHSKSNMLEFGPGSGLSGVSGVSAASGNSAVSSNNNLTRSQKNQHQFSSLHHQAHQPFDRLSLSENRGQQTSQQTHHVPVNNYMNSQANQEDHHIQQNQQQTQQNKMNTKMNLMSHMINTQSSKNLTSMSEQSTGVKIKVGSGPESNTQSKLSIKQQNVHTSKQMSQSIRMSKEKVSNNKYASCSPGIMKPSFGVSQGAGGGSNTASKSNRARSKKVQKHQSLEKFNNAALYGTQVIGGVNQSLIVPGTGSQLQLQNSQQSGAFPNGPQVQIKMQGNQQKVDQVFIQNTDSLFKHTMSLNSNTPDKIKMKQQQFSAINQRNNKDQPQRENPNQQAQMKGQILIQQNGNTENIQSSNESLVQQPQQNQSRSHSQMNLYSQGQIQLQAHNKKLMSKGNNGGVIINKQGNGNVLQFQTGSSGPNNTSGQIKKFTSNAQLQNIYRAGGVNHSSGRSDGLGGQAGSQTRSKSSKQQFRGNKNQSGSNIATFASGVSVQGNTQAAMGASLDQFYNSNGHQAQANRISILQNQPNNSRNSILKIYNTVGPQMNQNQNQPQYNSQQQIHTQLSMGQADQVSTTMRPISSSKNSRNAAGGQDGHGTSVDNMKDTLSSNEAMQKRAIHQNLIYIGNQNMHKNALLNHAQSVGGGQQKKVVNAAKIKKSEPPKLCKIQVNGGGGEQQQQQYHQVKIVDDQGAGQGKELAEVGAGNVNFGQAQSSQSIIAGFVQTGACDSSSTGATGGTSTGAALQRRCSSNQRENHKGSSSLVNISNGNHVNNVNMNNNMSLNSNKSANKSKNRDRNMSKKTDGNGKPLTATLSSQNQSLNNTQKIRQTSTKQAVASGSAVMSAANAGGQGNQSTKRSLSKNSQYATVNNAAGGPSPAPKTLAGKFSKMANAVGTSERHQASSFRQISSNKGPQSNSMTKSATNFDQISSSILRVNRTSSNPATNERQGSNKQRASNPLTALQSSGPAAGVPDHSKSEVSYLNSLYAQASGIQQPKQSSSQTQSQIGSKRGQHQPQVGNYQTISTANAPGVPASSTAVVSASVPLNSQSQKQIPKLPMAASIKGSGVNSRLGVRQDRHKA